MAASFAFSFGAGGRGTSSRSLSLSPDCLGFVAGRCGPPVWEDVSLLRLRPPRWDWGFLGPRAGLRPSPLWLPPGSFGAPGLSPCGWAPFIFITFIAPGHTYPPLLALLLQGSRSVRFGTSYSRSGTTAGTYGGSLTPPSHGSPMALPSSSACPPGSPSLLATLAAGFCSWLGSLVSRLALGSPRSLSWPSRWIDLAPIIIRRGGIDRVRSSAFWGENNILIL